VTKFLLNIGTPIVLFTGLVLFQLTGIRLEYSNIDWLAAILSLSAFIVSFLQVGYYLQNLRIGSFAINMVIVLVNLLIMTMLSWSILYFLGALFFRR
jgi:hypothetical protein